MSSFYNDRFQPWYIKNRSRLRQFGLLAALPTAAVIMMFRRQSGVGEDKLEHPLRLRQLHVYHRHGHRTPIAMLVKSVDAERSLWVDYLGSRANLIGTDDTWAGIQQNLTGTVINNLQEGEQTPHDDIRVVETTYPEDFMGRLTPRGAREMRMVGKWLRQRYVRQTKFLPDRLEDDWADTFSVFSTPYRRTIYSVDEMLKGLYPLEKRGPAPANGAKDGEAESDEATEDAPTASDEPYTGPVVSINVQEDRENEFHWVSLSDRLTEIRKDVLKSIRVRTREKQPTIARLSAFFQEHTPGPFSWTRIQDALRVRVASNLPIPHKLEKEDIQSVFEHFAWRWNRMYDSEESQQLAIGRVFGEMSSNMSDIFDTSKILEVREVAPDLKGKPKCSIFSCHDTTLFLMQKALTNDSAVSWPPYSAILVFELWEDKFPFLASDLYVRVLFNGTPVKLTALEEFEVPPMRDLYRYEDFLGHIDKFVLPSEKAWQEAEKHKGVDPHPSTGEPPAGRGALLV